MMEFFSTNNWKSSIHKTLQKQQLLQIKNLKGSNRNIEHNQARDWFWDVQVYANWWLGDEENFASQMP